MLQLASLFLMRLAGTQQFNTLPVIFALRAKAKRSPHAVCRRVNFREWLGLGSPTLAGPRARASRIACPQLSSSPPQPGLLTSQTITSPYVVLRTEYVCTCTDRLSARMINFFSMPDGRKFEVATLSASLSGCGPVCTIATSSRLAAISQGLIFAPTPHRHWSRIIVYYLDEAVVTERKGHLHRSQGMRIAIHVGSCRTKLTR